MAAAGIVTCDSFAGLRTLIRPASRSASERRAARVRGVSGAFGGALGAARGVARGHRQFAAAAVAMPRAAAGRRLERSGRWSLLPRPEQRSEERPASDLERSLSWESYMEEKWKGDGSALKPHHRQLLEPTRPIIELYDLESDPGEFHNRATDPELREVRRDLEYKLSDWMHETYDFLPPLWKSYPAADGPGRRDKL